MIFVQGKQSPSELASIFSVSKPAYNRCSWFCKYNVNVYFLHILWDSDIIFSLHPHIQISWLMNLTTHLCQVLTLRIHGATPLMPQNISAAWCLIKQLKCFHGMVLSYAQGDFPLPLYTVGG